MNKLDMAMQILLALLEKENDCDADGIAGFAFEIADAMQAEADKREPKGFPEVLQPEVDWRLAPKGAYKYKTSNDKAVWFVRDGIYTREVLAPSFGFTGAHVVERPQ